MYKITLKKIRGNVTTLVLLFLVCLPSFYKLLRPGFFSMYDDMQVIRVQQMDACIRDGQIPCRWVPDLGYGYGYPLYEYYAPLPYYTMELVHLSGFSFINSVKAGFILSIFLSALFMYLLSRNFFSKIASYAASFIYVYVPFRAASVYVRGAMGEAWGLATLPMVLFGFEYFLKKKDKASIVLFSTTIFLFLISHNLTVLISSPLIFLWIVIRLFQIGNFWENAKQLFVPIALGLSLASFYIIPLVIERNLVYLETLTQGYFNYISHFLSLNQLILSTHWGYGPSVVGSVDDAFLGIGPIHTIIVILASVILLMNKKKVNKDIKLFWFCIIAIFWGSLFLAHPRSTFIWKSISFLKYLQFPWRWVSIAAFTSAFLFGILVDYSKKLKITVILTFAVLILFVYGHYFSPKDWFYLTDSEKLSGDLYQRQITASIYDYLPKSAKELPKDAAPNSLIIKDGQVIISQSNTGSDWYSYDINVVSDVAKVVIPTYDFPTWKITVDGENTKVEEFGELGLISTMVSKGQHHVFAKLTKSTSRVIGDAITAAGFIILGVLLLKNKYAKKV